MIHKHDLILESCAVYQCSELTLTRIMATAEDHVMPEVLYFVGPYLNFQESQPSLITHSSGDLLFSYQTEELLVMVRWNQQGQLRWTQSFVRKSMFIMSSFPLSDILSYHLMHRRLKA